MSIPSCCQTDSKPPKFVLHSMKLIMWLLPGAALALMPKCPACVAAYIALVSGVGVSLSTASYLRTVLILLCLGSLLFLAARSVVRLLTRLPAVNEQ